MCPELRFCLSEFPSSCLYTVMLHFFGLFCMSTLNIFHFFACSLAYLILRLCFPDHPTHYATWWWQLIIVHDLLLCYCGFIAEEEQISNKNWFTTYIKLGWLSACLLVECVLMLVYYAGHILWEYDHNCPKLRGELNRQISLLEQNLGCWPLLCHLSWCWCKGNRRTSISYKEFHSSSLLAQLWCWIHSTQRCCSPSSTTAICSSSWREWYGKQVKIFKTYALST